MESISKLAYQYSQRIKKARDLMDEQCIDALLLLTGPNLVYFTGTPCGRSGSRPFLYLLPRKGDPVLIVHNGRVYEAQRFTGVADVRSYTQLSHLPMQTLQGALSDQRLERGTIGIEMGAEMVMDTPLNEYLELRNAFPAVNFIDASPLLWRLRMIKTPAEAVRVAKACKITLEAYDQTFRAIQPGMTEIEIERMLVCRMVSLGGTAPWTLITSGSGNYDLVSKGGSLRKVEPGDMIWMDAGCAVEGYFSDFSRAAVLGGPTKIQEEAHAEIHRITRMGIDMLRPGVPVAEIATCCNEAVRSLNLPITSNISELASRVGHGLGMVITELPSISEEDSTRVQAGMILTMEPGVATSFGTFHVEENVLITEEGPQVLTDGQWQLWNI